MVFELGRAAASTKVGAFAFLFSGTTDGFFGSSKEMSAKDVAKALLAQEKKEYTGYKGGFRVRPAVYVEQPAPMWGRMNFWKGVETLENTEIKSIDEFKAWFQNVAKPQLDREATRA
jgi:hypothetical protein